MDTLSQRFARSALRAPITCVAIAAPIPDLTVPQALLERAFGPSFDVIGVTDANGGRGVFSRVLRVELSWSVDGPAAGRPETAVVKLPADGPNGAAALASGAYQREALAYEHLLSSAPVATPFCYLVEVDDDGATSLVLEDLGRHRAVDQLDGLGLGDTLAVAEALQALHRHWQSHPDLASLHVRRATPSLLAPDALRRGVETLRRHWADESRPWLDTFERMVERRSALVEHFASAAEPTLCHGDPRADNLVFGSSGRPVLFDWQQLAVQLGEADLAWLAATSLHTEQRRRLDDELLATYDTSVDRYRTGLILPGLAVLLLAQRTLDDERSKQFVATSIARIGAAVTDYDVPGLVGNR